MSPPTRKSAQLDLDQPTTSRAGPEVAPSKPTVEVDAAHAAIISAQQSAGNRAVASILGGGGGVQRAPKDDAPPPPSFVETQTAVSAAPGPPAGPQMQVSPQTIDSAAPAPKSAVSQGGGGGTGDGPWAAPQAGPLAPPMESRVKNDPRFALGGEFGPRPVPEGQFGGVASARTAKADAIEVGPDNVRTAFERNPARVIRSPSETWHREAFHKADGFKKFGDDATVPRAFSDGSVIVVAPNYAGPASKLPYYAAIGGAGSAPAPAGPTAPPPAPIAGGERPMARMPQSRDERAEAQQRQAVAPDIAPKGPWGSQVAQRVTYQEVAEAYAKDPASVVRSPNDRWHGQGYRTDGGKGGTPGAFKVGNQYVISPGYPVDNVPYLAVPGSGPGGPAPQAGPATPKGALPPAAQTVAPGATTYAEGGALRSYEATTSTSGDRTETRTRSRSQAIVTTTTEVTGGGVTNRQEQQRGAGFGAGGNLIGAVAGSTDTSKIDGDVVAAKRSKQVTAGLGKDMKLGTEAKATKETVIGTDPEGNPIKTSTTAKATGKADLKGWELGGGADRTSGKGTTTGAGAKVKGDWKGNVEIEAYLNLQTKSGISFKPTVSHGIKVEASEPIELPGGEFEVVYRIVETTGVGVGAGKQLGGGANVGVNVGATHGEFQGGRRGFKSKADANAFRDNAAARVATEQLLSGNVPVTTVAGALQMPVGETRTTGEISGKTIGAQAGYSGVAVNVGKSKSTTHELAVKRTGQATFEVTGSVTGSKTGSVGISAPVLSHGYSSTGTKSFSVTFEFDVSKEQGRAAFELYCKTGIPPLQPPKVIENASSDADHETVSIPGLGSAVWTGTTWKVSRDTADGHSTQVYGGAQSHAQTTGWVGRHLGEDTLNSNAQIVRVVQDGQEVGARAQFDVGGTSGEYNRAEFGKIFSGAKTDKDAKSSGQWTLSADVPKENIRALEQSSKKIRNAMDEREAYSELVKENGAQMLGGQVGMSSKNWDLELKGDPNFPGEKERTRLKELRKSLMARVRTNPELANDIVRETGEELAKLDKRREAVADVKRYTDLPDGLRQQQLGVIDTHIDDLKVVRRTAQAIAMKRNSGERAADVATRVDQEEAAKHPAKKGPRAAKKAPVDDEKAKSDLEYARLQDQASAKEAKTAAKRKEIHDFSKALGDAIGAKGTTAVKFGADTAVVQVAIASGKGYIGVATDMDKKQAALDPRIEELRNAWSAASDRNDRNAQLEALRSLVKVLDERLKLMESCLFFIREAGKAVFHITTRSAKSGNPAFWNSLGETEGED
jgi:hypothetical protein